MQRLSRDRVFERWVSERLSGWPAEQILAFEHWLLEQEHYEFIPAVRDAREQREAGDRGRSAGLSNPINASPRINGALATREVR